MSYVKGLSAASAAPRRRIAPLHVCETCFGPLEVAYDYDAIRRALTRELDRERGRATSGAIASCCRSTASRTIGLHSGFTPLVRADRLAAALGVKELWVKDDSVNHPTFSYKDRVVSVAISKAIEFGFDTVSCASTGNLANCVSAHAARAGPQLLHLHPRRPRAGQGDRLDDLRPARRRRSAATTTTSTACAARSPTSTAGPSSTSTCARTTPKARRPTASRSPSSSAGSCRSTSSSRPPAARSCRRSPRRSRSCATSAWSTATVEDLLARRPPAARRSSRRSTSGTDLIEPVKPNTIAKSIAIGNPADGYYVLKAVRESGGWGEIGHRRGDRRRHPAARRDRRHLHRARRRHHRRGHARS